MRIPALLASLVCLSIPLLAQVPDPGASQDEEAAREKILKAADQLDMMEGNAESTKTAVDGMKTDMAKLRDENTALKLEVDTLQQTVQKLEDDRAKDREDRASERQVLLDEVSKLVATRSSSSSSPKASVKKQEAAPDTDTDKPSLAPPPDAPTSGPTNPAESAGASDSASSSSTQDGDAQTDSNPPNPPKPRKGYSHVVAAGETLTLICQAFRDQGVKVTVAQIRKANGLTEKSTLKVGQKLFIPKSGA